MTYFASILHFKPRNCPILKFHVTILAFTKANQELRQYSCYIVKCLMMLYLIAQIGKILHDVDIL